MSHSIAIRPPRATVTASSLEGAKHDPPSVDWLAGTWHITHSSLPMWKSKRNVRVTYTPQTATSSSTQVDDLVSYQGLSSDKTSTVRGIDTIQSAGDTGAWDWRGKGWLMIASSRWEVLGWGNVNDAGAAVDGGVEDAQWVVTYFSKTIFTPAGIDIYSRKKEGLSTELIESIKDALTSVEDPLVRKSVEGLFEVKQK